MRVGVAVERVVCVAVLVGHEFPKVALDVAEQSLFRFVDDDAGGGVLDEDGTEAVPEIVGNRGLDLVGDVDDVEAVALDGLDHGFTDATEDAAEGLGDAFDAAPLTWEGNRLRSPVKESLLELTKATASDADYSTFRAVFHPLNFQMTVLLRRRPNSNVTHHVVGDYYSREIVDIFEALADRYGPAVQDQDINWISPTEGRKWTLPDEAEPLRHVWREYACFTETVLRYRVSEEEYPFVEGSIDVIIQDVATRGQADVAIQNAEFLHSDGRLILAVKARSEDVTANPEAVFDTVLSELESTYTIETTQQLDRFHDDHLGVVATRR